MRKIRNCTSAQLNTGGSACRINWDKILGAILVEPGKKLPADITVDALMEACHADRPDRIYPIVTFTEYSKNGGEPQVSAEGYGANMYNGMNARTDTFTLNVFDEMLNASLIRTANKEWDAYYFDKNVIIRYKENRLDFLVLIDKKDMKKSYNKYIKNITTLDDIMLLYIRGVKCED